MNVCTALFAIIGTGVQFPVTTRVHSSGNIVTHTVSILLIGIISLYLLVQGRGALKVTVISFSALNLHWW